MGQLPRFQWYINSQVLTEWMWSNSLWHTVEICSAIDPNTNKMWIDYFSLLIIELQGCWDSRLFYKVHLDSLVFVDFPSRCPIVTSRRRRSDTRLGLCCSSFPWCSEAIRRCCLCKIRDRMRCLVWLRIHAVPTDYMQAYVVLEWISSMQARSTDIASRTIVMGVSDIMGGKVAGHVVGGGKQQQKVVGVEHGVSGWADAFHGVLLCRGRT